MSLFGKILAIFNVFAVLGTLALMAMNYAKRQSWEYAVFRQDLMINGLPITKDRERRTASSRSWTRSATKTQQDLFKQASPTTPVATQQHEVERVKASCGHQYQECRRQEETNRRAGSHSDADGRHHRAAPADDRLPDASARRQDVCRPQTAFQGCGQAAKNRRQGRPAEALRGSVSRRHSPLIFSDPPGPLAEAFLAAKKADPATDVDKALEQSLDTQLTQLQGQFEPDVQ